MQIAYRICASIIVTFALCTAAFIRPVHAYDRPIGPLFYGPFPSERGNTPTPTKPPEPTATPPSTPTSTPAPVSSNSLNADTMFSLINAHRQSMGLPAFEKEEKLCQLAASRAPELYDEIFVTGKVHAGFDARNLPYWITENMVSRPTEQEGFNWWLSSSLHRRAIEGNFKYSCGACSGNSCAQLFTSYDPK